MMRIERHPRVDADVDEALAYTFKEFGGAQVPIYESLIVEGLRTIRGQPSIGRLREDIGSGIRVFCIAQPGIKAPHGYVYRIKGSVIQVARFVHLARYLPALIPEDF
jgi:plasmid stabilization system protein ParE